MHVYKCLEKKYLQNTVINHAKILTDSIRKQERVKLSHENTVPQADIKIA